MTSAPVLVDASGPVWHVALNRPLQGNACSADLVCELDEAFARAEAEGAQALVLQGEGRHFCTGFDLSNLDRETDDTLLARFVRIELLLQRVANAPFLTVAFAHGRTLGAGADLFTSCQLRFAHSDTSFAFPGARGFGLVLGTRRLAARVGAETAMAWVESARSVGCEEARRTGLVTAIAESPQSVTEAVADRLHGNGDLGAAVRAAVAPQSGADDARDLQLLVRSAAVPGLHERIGAYLQHSVAVRRASPASTFP